MSPLRQPVEALPSDLDPPFAHQPVYSGTGPDRDAEAERWEVTVNKKTSEWVAAGFSDEGDQIVEHRFNPGSPRGNYWSHSAEEYDQIGGAMSRDITAWVEHLVAPERPTDAPQTAP